MDGNGDGVHFKIGEKANGSCLFYAELLRGTDARGKIDK